MSKKSLESAIRDLSEGKESGSPTPKKATPGNIGFPSEGGAPSKGNDPKAKGSPNDAAKDKLLTDPNEKLKDMDKVSDATSKAKSRKADKSGAEPRQFLKKEEEEIEVDDTEVLDEEEIELDDAIVELVSDLDEDELRVRYAELLSTVLAEEDDEDGIDEEQIEETVSEIRRRITADDLDLSEDVEALLGDEDLSEEFQTKAKTIFEAAVLLQVNNKLDELEEEFKRELVEEIERYETELTDKVDEYLTYVVNEWMEKNELAVERGLRGEIAEDFMRGLQTLFVKHYVDIPEEKIDVLDELASEIDELKVALSEQMEKNIDLATELSDAMKREIMSEELCDLADSQIEKVVALAENIAFEDENQYREAINILKESYSTKSEKNESDDIDDDFESLDEELSALLEEDDAPKHGSLITEAGRMLSRQQKRA